MIHLILLNMTKNKLHIQQSSLIQIAEDIFFKNGIKDVLIIMMQAK